MAHHDTARSQSDEMLPCLVCAAWKAQHEFTKLASGTVDTQPDNTHLDEHVAGIAATEESDVPLPNTCRTVGQQRGGVEQMG